MQQTRMQVGIFFLIVTLFMFLLGFYVDEFFYRFMVMTIMSVGQFIAYAIAR